MLGRRVVLVVEDDPSMLEGIRDVLELDGYEVVTASTGVEGLERLNQITPSLILSDVMMPEMDGLQFCERVRSNPAWATTPLIFLTAKGQKLDVRSGMYVGADDYLTKPFEPQEILDAVSARLKRVASITSETDNTIGKLRSSIMRLISHELRTPLTFVKGYTELLEESVGDLSTSELTEFLRSIRAGSDRLTDLVDDLIFLVSLQTGEAKQTYEYGKTSLDLAHVATRVVAALREKAAVRGMALVDRLAGRMLPVIGHQDLLADAVARLLENAIKFGRAEGGQVIVAGQAFPDQARLWIVDNGVGIPASELDRIFDVFYQVDRDRMEQQGAGLGLPIAKGILELHGGTVAAESRVGIGSTFTISLPSASSAVEQQQIERPAYDISLTYGG